MSDTSLYLVSTPSSAKAGDSVQIETNILNLTNATHSMYYEIWELTSAGQTLLKSATVSIAANARITPFVSFVMPNDTNIESYLYVEIDGNYDNSTTTPIPLIGTTPTNYTHFVSINAPLNAVAQSTVNFTVVVQNISSQSISVQLTAKFSSNTIDVDATIDNPIVTLAAGQQQTFTGSLVMPNVSGTLVIDTAVENISGIYVQDQETVGYLSLISGVVPTLTINPTTVMQGDALTFSFTGFAPLTDVNITVVTNPNDYITVTSDKSGNGNGSIVINDAPGPYTLRATDTTGLQGSDADFTVTTKVFTIPSDYKIVQQTDYAAKKTYSGNAQRCIATFSFLPANWPGINWFIKETFDKKIEDEITAKGEQPLDMTLYESPDGFDYILIMEATLTTSAAFNGAVAQGPFLPWEIIGGLIVVGLIILFFTIKEITEFVIKAPAAALGTGLLVVGGLAIVVVGIAIFKGTSVKQAITGKT